MSFHIFFQPEFVFLGSQNTHQEQTDIVESNSYKVDESELRFWTDGLSLSYKALGFVLPLKTTHPSPARY